MWQDGRLEDLGGGLWAWLQGDGGWGWSNAGLVTSGGEACLVDTLFDEPLTDRMLRAMEASCGVDRAAIGTVVNTHANGDHCHGNALVAQAEIVASAAAAAEMERLPPAAMAELKAAAQAGQLGEAGRYFADIFAPFDFRSVRHRPPTRTFEGTAALDVGDLRMTLLEVGPAHTAGDVIAHVPAARTVFTGDILFVDGTPIVWAGPVSNWIAACDLILSLDAEHIVPGHGPLAGPAEVREVADYLAEMEAQALARFEAGMGAFEAALDMAAAGALARWGSWRDAERLAVNVDTVWRTWAGQPEPTPPLELFSRMSKLYFDRRSITR